MKLSTSPIQKALLAVLASTTMALIPMETAAQPAPVPQQELGAWNNGVYYPQGYGILNANRQQGLPEPVDTSEPPGGSGGGYGAWNNGVWYPQGYGIVNVNRQQGLPEPVDTSEPPGGSGGGYGAWNNGVWYPQGYGIVNANRQRGLPDNAHVHGGYAPPREHNPVGRGGISVNANWGAGERITRTPQGVSAGIGIRVSPSGKVGISGGVSVQAGGVRIGVGGSGNIGGNNSHGNRPIHNSQSIPNAPTIE